MFLRPVFVRIYAGLCGAVFAYGFAPQSWVIPACAALTIFAGLVYNARRLRDAFWIGYLFGLGQFAVNFSWIANAFAVREGFSYPQGLVAVFGLALAMALYPGIAAFVSQRLVRNHLSPLVFASAFAVCWFLAEVARGTFFSGFPWNPVGALWATVMPVAQLASVVGVFGLSAVSVFIAALVASSAVWRASYRQRLVPACAAAALFASIFAFGLWRIPSGPMPSYRDLALVLVQANVPQDKKWDRSLLETHLRAHVELSNDALTGDARRKIVVWPETAYPYLIDRSPSAQRELQSALGDNTVLFFGANRLVGQAGEESAHNVMFVLRAGAIAAQYDKVHLVPFGEYLPFADLLRRLGVETLVGALAGFLPGPGPTVIDLDGLPLAAPLICYEGIFPDLVGQLPRRPEWILNISNDAWFGASAGPYQHMNLARFRAIENGVSLVRSTGTGISAVMDPYGRTTDSLGLGIQGSLVAGLPKPLERPTVFSALRGGSTIYITCIFMLSFAVARLYRSRVQKKPDEF